MIPDINEIRTITADEQNIQSYVDTFTYAVANGIQQEARKGQTYYEYMLLPDVPSFKLEAMKRVEKAYKDAGYIVTRPQYNNCNNITFIRFSWSKEEY